MPIAQTCSIFDASTKLLITSREPCKAEWMDFYPQKFINMHTYTDCYRKESGRKDIPFTLYYNMHIFTYLYATQS